MCLYGFSQSSASTSLGTTEKDNLEGRFDTVEFEDLALERNVYLLKEMLGLFCVDPEKGTWTHRWKVQRVKCCLSIKYNILNIRTV